MRYEPYSFSIIKGGPFSRFLNRWGLSPEVHRSNARLVGLFILVTWVPMAILALLDGVFFAGSVGVPFLLEPAIHIRFLLVGPMLMLIDRMVDDKTRQAVNQFMRSGMVLPNKLPAFRAALAKVDAMCESKWPEWVMLILIIGNVLLRTLQFDLTITTWAFPQADGQLSWAGYWFAFCGLPLIQFLILRWIWRWMLWIILLRKLNAVGLQLAPTHPDGAGGLGFLGVPPMAFTPLTLILGILLSGVLWERLTYHQMTFQDTYPFLGAYAILSIVIHLAPLLMFSKTLWLLRQEGLAAIGPRVTRWHLLNYSKIQSTEPSVESGDELPEESGHGVEEWAIQYEQVVNLSPFPFQIKSMLFSLALTLVPILPVVLVKIPLKELIQLIFEFLG
jgi:hypothetical protein